LEFYVFASKAAAATAARTTTGSFTESLAVRYAILLLLQAAIEFGKEEKGFVVSLNNNND